jgi:NACalpha-BTF3-like transcription factor
MGSIAVDNSKNAGSAGGKDSTYFAAGSDSSSSTHSVTLNYGQGHWCSCRGMIAKKKKFGSVADTHQNVGIAQTSRHYCKHVTSVRAADPSIRIEARRIRNDAFGISEPPVDAETGATIEPVAQAPKAPTQPTGRRAAIAAQKAKSAPERLAEIEIELAAARKTVELEDAIAALRVSHGDDAVKAALEA